MKAKEGSENKIKGKVLRWEGIGSKEREGRRDGKIQERDVEREGKEVKGGKKYIKKEEREAGKRREWK